MLKRERGFGIIELMVSITILLIIVFTVLTVINVALFKHMEVKEKVIAVNLAQAVDALIESMDDIAILDGTTAVPIHKFSGDDSELLDWKPVVMLTTPTGDPQLTITVDINGVEYTVRAYARLSYVYGMEPGDPPHREMLSPIVSRDLIVVSYVISWKSVNGRDIRMAFVRRYYKKGVS